MSSGDCKTLGQCTALAPGGLPDLPWSFPGAPLTPGGRLPVHVPACAFVACFLVWLLRR